MSNQLDITKLFSNAARDRMGTIGQRQWGMAAGGPGGPRVTYSFEGGLPDPSTYPVEGIIQATATALRNDKMAFNYGGVMGFDGFRAQVLRLENLHGGQQATLDNVMITSGASQALRLVYDALLNAGDTVLLEDHSYIAQQIKTVKPNVVTVPFDVQGPDVAVMRQRLTELKGKGITPKFMYLVTGFHNPLGMAIPAARLQQVLDLAYEFGFFILEDDPYSRIRYQGEDAPTLYSLDTTGTHVIRAGTVSKILGAGLRLGWVIAHPDLLRAFAQFKQDGGTNPFTQRIAAQFWKDHLWDHIKVVTASYKHKRDTMMSAMSAYCKNLSEWNAPDGGIFLWVKLHQDVDDDKLMKYALEEEVAYRPGSAFASNGNGSGKGYLRLAYSFQDPETITAGIERLGHAMHRAAD